MSWAPAWVLWLAVPVLVTVLAAVTSWVRSRPRRLPDTAESMRAHTAYLDALGASVRRVSSTTPSPDAAPDRPAEDG